MAERPPRPSFDDALAIVRAEAPDPAPIGMRLDEAYGCVAAEPVLAHFDYPRFDVSAMDGFALASADTLAASEQRPIALPVLSTARTGAPAASVAPGTACHISTGAPIPLNCDTVLARERAQLEDGMLRLTAPAIADRNIRRRGEDALAGACVVDVGRVLSPEIIGALACYGVDRVTVARPPTLSILSTGDELLAGPAAGGIADGNGTMIAAMARALGLAFERLPPVGDDAEATGLALRQAMAASSNIIISTGGVSVGDHDYLPVALRQAGAQIHFHGVAMRPGKPVLFATLPNGSLYFGLPGNPVAAALGFRFFVTAAVRAMSGLPAESGRPVTVEVEPRPGVTSLLKARSVTCPEGTRIEILADQRSHTMRPLIDANCWLAVDRAASGETRCRHYPLSAPLGDRAD